MPSKNFLVYRSSAGSGKTFTLVKEYLKIALDDTANPPVRFRHINAMTFTNKAAAEMKDRVIRTLSGISAGEKKSDAYAEILMKELSLGKEDLKRRAASLLTSILHHYSDFTITTIDSFVHRIIRAFAQDLRLPVNFEVSTDTKKTMEAAVDLMLSSASPGALITQFLVEFTEQHLDDERSWDIRRELNDFMDKLLKNIDKEGLTRIRNIAPEKIIAAKEHLSGEVNRFRDAIRRFGEEGLQLIRTAGAETAFYQGSRGLPAWLGYLSQGRDDKLSPNSYALATIRDNKWYGGKTSASEKAAIDGIKAALTALFDKANAFILKEEKEYLLRKMILKNIFSLGVSRAVLEELDRLKKEDHVVWIDDLNDMISSIVTEQPAPFVYERAGERFRHYLIDEFQDTSVIQWRNILPLIHHALSEGNTNLVVGDGKQAIYRWRGGDVEQFQALPSVVNPTGNPVVAERALALKNNISIEVLGKNFRSLPGITAFNNDFFTFMAQRAPETVRQVYHDVSQESEPGKEGGFVSLEFNDEKISNKPDEKRVIELIHEARQKAFAFSDIAILTRGNKEGSKIALHLQKHHIPVISSDSLLVASAPQVRFLAALLELISTPSSLIPRAVCLEFLSARASPGKEVPFLLCRRNREFFDFLSKNGFDPRDARIRKLPLVELCERIIRDFRLASGSDPYIPAFSDLVFTFSSRKGNDLAAFLNWWEEKKATESINLPEGMDAVRVMTIHKSKGLEFPVVILPWCNWDAAKLHDITLINTDIPGLETTIVEYRKDLSRTEHALLLEEEQGKTVLDNLNLLYVAMTRAAEKLFILTSPPGMKRTVSPWFIDYLGAKGIYAEDRQVYTFGSDDTKRGAAHRTAAGKSLGNYISAEWKDRIFVRHSGNIAGLRVEELNKRQTGILVHETLACMRTRQDAENAVAMMKKKRMLCDEDAQWMMEEIARILSKEAIAKLFDHPGALAERDIVLPDGEIKRADRIIFRGDSLEVIDFKTGEEKEEHVKQVAEYVKAMRQSGYKKVIGKLVYTDRLVIKMVNGQ